MSSTRAEVLLWAQRVISRKGSPAHTILELRPDSTVDDAQQAFYKIARIAHPDLHRNHLTPEELELVTSAYSTAAGAYQDFRSQAQRVKPANPEDLAAVGAAPAAPPRRAAGPTTPPPSGVLAAGPIDQQMSPRALLYYRKAEIALRRGDFKGAILQIKMAIATDPASAFLRTALAEVETELRKGS